MVETANRTGVVNTDGLNVRAAPNAKAPVLKALAKGAAVTIRGESRNGETRWLASEGGYVAARYVDLR